MNAKKILLQGIAVEFQLPYSAAAETLWSAGACSSMRKRASALHKYLKGANLYLDYYRVLKNLTMPCYPLNWDSLMIVGCSPLNYTRGDAIQAVYEAVS